MIAPALLLAYAVIMGSIGARQLQRARWPQRSPRLGMLAWQALSVSIVLAALLTGVTLAVPTLPMSTQLATLLDACWLAIREQYSTPGGATVASVGVLLVVAVLGRLGFSLAVEVLSAFYRRREQRRRLMIVAPSDPSRCWLCRTPRLPFTACRAGPVLWFALAPQSLRWTGANCG